MRAFCPRFSRYALSRLAIAVAVAIAVASGSAPATARLAAEPSTSASAPGVDTPGPGRPRVHIDVQGRMPVQLYDVSGGVEPGTSDRDGEPVAREICTAPCDRVVDGTRAQQFVIAGRGVSRSLPFTLIDADEALTIHVRPGRRALRIAGWVLASLGAAAVIAGATTLTAADDDRTIRRAGGFTFIAGLPVLAGGIVMIAFGRTRFRLGDAPPRSDRRRLRGG